MNNFDDNISAILNNAEELQTDENLKLTITHDRSCPTELSHAVAARSQVSSTYNLDVLYERYPEIPTEGVTWAQSGVISRDDFKYTRIKAEPEYNSDGTIKKYTKRPLDKWKNPKYCKSWSDLKNGDDYAVIVSHPYLCVDIDDELEARIVFKYILEKGIKCMVMKTTRGCHFWFKLPDSIDYEATDTKNESKVFVLGTLSSVDYRVNGGGLATLKILGQDRMIIYGGEIPPDAWDPPPLVLMKLRKVNPSEYDFIGLQEGNRDNLLNRYKAALYGREQLSVAETFEVLTFVNNYLLAAPLAEAEMSKFANASNYEGIVRELDSSQFFKKSKFLHEKFAKCLASKYYFVPTDNRSWPLIYKDGYYQQDDAGIEMLVRDLVPELTTNNIVQIQSALYIEAVRRLRKLPNALDENGVIKEDPFHVNVKNGRLNMLTGELSEHSPMFIDTQRVPTVFNPEARSDAVDEVLNNVFQGDAELIDLFFQVCGSCLIRDNHLFARSFFFVGEGSNGKSTVLRMMRAMLGNKNICCVKPSEMVGNSFNLANLEHKLANIVEELSSADVDDTDVYKQVVAGDVISANRKFKEAVLFNPYSTCVFAMNEVPNFKDKSLGMKRRYECIPFNANFEKLKREHPESFDPSISDRITSEEAKSYLLNMSVDAFIIAYHNKDYSVPQSCKDLKEQILADYNPVIQWLSEEQYTAEELTKHSINSLYESFRYYQRERLGQQNGWSRKKWKDEVIRYYCEDLDPKPKRVRLNPCERGKLDTVFVLKRKRH